MDIPWRRATPRDAAKDRRARLRYEPAAGVAGLATLTISCTDGGATGAGGARSASRVVALRVAADAAPPVSDEVDALSSSLGAAALEAASSPRPLGAATRRRPSSSLGAAAATARLVVGSAVVATDEDVAAPCGSALTLEGGYESDVREVEILGPPGLGAVRFGDEKHSRTHRESDDGVWIRGNASAVNAVLAA